MDLLNQHGYVILSLFKQSMSLSLAVNIVALPITLLYFQSFPLMGIIFNFFFPFLISISMLLLFISLLIAWIPPLSSLLHALNHVFTHQVLCLTFNMPENLDYAIRLKLNASELVIYISIVFAAGIFWKGKIARKWESDKRILFFLIKKRDSKI